MGSVIISLINYTTLFPLARVAYLKNDIRNKKDGQGSIVLCPRLNIEILLQAEKDCIANIHSVQNQQSPLVALSWPEGREENKPIEKRHEIQHTQKREDV